MNTRILTRIGAALVAIVAVTGLAFAGATDATAESDERTLSLTRPDGSPIGTLFTDWTMVPGDTVTTTVVAHRTGGGESSLMITLGDGSISSTSPTTVEKDVIITVVGNGIRSTSSAADLMHADVVFDLGRSAARDVPIDVTFELPFSSGNETQLQSLDLSLVVVAADIAPTPTPDPTPDSTPVANPDPTAPGDAAGGSILPNLPTTGASIRDVLIAAAVVTCLGLLIIGGRRRRDEAVEPD